jgi:hypothetical protein
VTFSGPFSGPLDLCKAIFVLAQRYAKIASYLCATIIFATLFIPTGFDSSILRESDFAKN